MQHYYSTPFQDVHGEVLVGLVVLVTRGATPGGPVASLYSDNGITPKANPLTTDARGGVDFYAANGVYTLSCPGFTQAIELFSIVDTFPNVTSPVNASAGEMNKLVGVTSNIQAQINAKAPSEVTYAASGGAALIGNQPAGNIAATTVQAALNELDSEKASLTALSSSGGAATVGYGSGTVADALLRIGSQPESAGAVANGIANDTAALQATFDASNHVILTAGRTYCFTNLTFPNTADWTLECPGGRATLKCIAGGDASYGVASDNWVNNAGYVGNPVHMRNIVFDGNGGCADVNKHMSWNSTFEYVEWMGGTNDGFVPTGANKAGSTISNTMPNTRMVQCAGHHNGRDGVRTEGVKPTDIQIEGGYYHNNGRYGINPATCAGLQMDPAPHTYSNGTAGLYLQGYGFGAVIDGGYFEDAVIIASLNASAAYPVLGSNRHRGDIICNFGEAGASVLRIVEPTLEGTARIVHNNNSATKTIIVEGGSSESATPIVWGGDFWAGVVECDRHYGHGVGGMLDGRQSVMLSTHAAGPAPNELIVNALPNSGTTTNFTVTITVPVQQNAGFDIEIDLEMRCVSNSFNDFDLYKGTFFASWTRKQSSSAAIHSAVLVSEVADASPGISVAIGGWTWAGSAGEMVPTFTLTITHPAPSDRNASPIRAVVRAHHRFTTAMTAA